METEEMTKILKIIDVACTGEFRGKKNFMVESDKGMFGLYDEELAQDMLENKGKSYECKMKVSQNSGKEYILDGVLAQGVVSQPYTTYPHPEVIVKTQNGQRNGMLFNNAVQIYISGKYPSAEGVLHLDNVALIYAQLKKIMDTLEK